MTIPASSSYPEKMDDDDNLFLVHDSLRMKLSQDYRPGDTTIYVEGDPEVMAKFPATGIITLTEQCSDIDQRALSFYYSSLTRTEPYSFGGLDEGGNPLLEILPEFAHLDSSKPKRATNVTINVVSMHHNHLKDALVQVEEFLGSEYNTRKGTVTDRIRTLKRVALAPKAWFSADKLYGLASPALKVTFTNDSLRVGEGYLKQTWTFIRKPTAETAGQTTIKVVETNGKNEYQSERTHEESLSVGVYTVSLSVENEYGSDEVQFEDMIVAKTECPDEATIQIKYKVSQNLIPGNRPKIRSSAGTMIDLEVPDGPNPENPGYSFAGELMAEGKRIDEIVEYSWKLGDDLPHENSRFARASYVKGGYYDMTLRVDTSFGSYRITTYEKSIDIVEQSNLWLFINGPASNSSSSSISGDIIQAYEFGLVSETFKTLGGSQPIQRDNSFLSKYNSPDYYSSAFERAKKEFDNNVEFARSGNSDSGDKGNALMFWAKGGSSVDSKQIGVLKFNGFDDSYQNLAPLTDRPWNWVAMSSSDRTYFVFGESGASPGPRQNPVLAQKVEYDMATELASAPISLSSSDFENGADELLVVPSRYNEAGRATNGNFVSYRSAWKDQTGYILRNSSVNEFFRLGDFYRTSGSLSSPFGTITRLPDMPGSVKTEGQMVALFNGVFFFNNSGEICAWNDISLTWEVGRASSTSLSFRTVQDTSVQNFGDKSNTLKATSDGDRAAYLSYDYASKAFLKFNGTDLTFTSLRQRPEGNQFKMGVY